MSPTGPVEGSSLAVVQARVAAVQARLAAFGARAASGSGAAFAGVLATAASASSSPVAGPSSTAVSTAVSAAASAASPVDAAGAGAATAGAYLRPTALRASSGAAPYQGLFDAATARYGLPTGLLAAVAQTESGYDADAVSPAGARGLMQIMPGTARELGVDALDPAQAVDGAARLLSRHLGSFGSLELALAAYNAGPGNVRKHGGVPPFTETQNYVRKVTDAMTRSA